MAREEAMRTILPALVAGMYLPALGGGGCTPKVQVEASDKPITINLNVKIEHEIKVKVEKALDDVLSSDKGLF